MAQNKQLNNRTSNESALFILKDTAGFKDHKIIIHTQLKCVKNIRSYYPKLKDLNLSINYYKYCSTTPKWQKIYIKVKNKKIVTLDFLADAYKDLKALYDYEFERPLVRRVYLLKGKKGNLYEIVGEGEVFYIFSLYSVNGKHLGSISTSKGSNIYSNRYYDTLKRFGIKKNHREDFDYLERSAII